MNGFPRKTLSSVSGLRHRLLYTSLGLRALGFIDSFQLISSSLPPVALQRGAVCRGAAAAAAAEWSATDEGTETYPIVLSGHQ